MSSVGDIGECAICFERFSDDFDHTPKLLLCGHSFCQRDLTHLAMSDSIKCPNGCGFTHLGATGVKGLKSNFSLMEIVRSLPKKQESKCEECGVDPVSMFCATCDAEFCQPCCKKAHSFRTAKNHKRLTGRRPLEQSTCLEHENHPLDLFCKREQVPICILCRDYGDHKTHSEEVDLLSSVSTFQKDKLQQSLEKLNGQSKHLRQMSQCLAVAEGALEKNATKAKDEIKTQFKRQLKEMEKRKVHLLDKVDQEQQIKSVSIRSQRQELASHISSLDTVSQQVEVLLNGDKLLQMKNYDITRRAEETVSVALGVNIDIADSEIFCDLGDDIITSLRSYGAVGRPPAPVLYVDCKCSDSSVELSWSDANSTPGLEYSAELCTLDDDLKDNEWTESGKCDGNKKSMSLKNLLMAFHYSARIRGRYAAGWSGYSNIIRFETPNVLVGWKYEFNSCGKKGAFGPSQQECDKSYAGTWLETSVTIDGGIQIWTVPRTAKYVIEAFGACGSAKESHTYKAGGGAVMVGEFSLQKGSRLNILVGQEGTADVSCGGGGGGSFVVDIGPADGAVTSSARLDRLIIAGGGGGICNCANQDGFGGRITTEGGKGSGSGCTGQDVSSKSPIGYGGTVINHACYGQSGAGFKGDGTENISYNRRNLGFVNGGTGGVPSAKQYTSEGGFGGGGSGRGSCGGGGGGGFTGGGGGPLAGGGGSYNKGHNRSNNAGKNHGSGQVIITIKG